MTSLQNFLNIDYNVSTKHEIIFNNINNGTRILLKIRNRYTQDLKQKLAILTKNKKTWNHILPFSYIKRDFIDVLNKQFSIATYEQIKMISLREEIQNKLSANEQFSTEEILSIFHKIEATFKFLYGLEIFPSFITIDNICYDPRKPTKEWVLSIQNFFKYAEPHDLEQKQYFSYQLSEEFYEKLKKKNKVGQLPPLAIQKENYMNLGICLLQACLLQLDQSNICNSYHNNNRNIKTLNYYYIFTKNLKMIFNSYNLQILNLVKFMIASPQKYIKTNGESFWDYIPIIENIAELQELVNNKQADLAMTKINQIQIKFEGRIDFGDRLKLKIIQSQCLNLNKNYKEFWVFNEQILKELKQRFTEERIHEHEELAVYLKQLSKRFLIQRELKEFDKQKETLNKILNEIYWLKKVVMKQFKNKKAFCIKYLQTILQFLIQIFPEFSCNQPDFGNNVEVFANYTEASINICLTILNLMKLCEQFENSIKKEFYQLKEIQSDILFIAQINYNREDNLCEDQQEQINSFEDQVKQKKQHKISKKNKQQLNFVNCNNQEQSNIQYPLKKRVC